MVTNTRSHDQRALSTAEAFARDWGAVADFQRKALLEVATELGGTALRAEFENTLAATPGLWSGLATCMNRLDESFPGSALQVMKRSMEIQRQTHEQEVAVFRRGHWQQLLVGLRYLTMFPPRRRR